MRRELKENEKYIIDYITKNASNDHSSNLKSMLFFVLLSILCLTVDYGMIMKIIRGSLTKSSIILTILCLILANFFLYISIAYIIRNVKRTFKNYTRKKDSDEIKVFDTELIKLEKGVNGYNDLGYVLNEKEKEVVGIVIDHEYIEEHNNKCLLVNDPVNIEINYIFPVYKFEKKKHQ